MEENNLLFYQLFCEGKHSDAMKICDAVIMRNPSPAAYCNRAIVHMSMDLCRRSIKDFDAAIALNPSHLLAYLRKGEVLAKLGKREEAISVWNSGLKQFGDIDIYLQIQSELQKLKEYSSQLKTPQNENTSNREKRNVGTTTVQAEDGRILSTSKAVSEIAARGLVQHGVGKKEVDEMIALGYLYVNTGKLQQALELFSQLLTKNPNLVAAFLGRGTAFALARELEKAIEDFSAAIRINPEVSDAWKRRGQARSARGLDNEALADITKAIELAPKECDGYHQRGLIYYKQKNFRRAIQDFEKVCSLDKTNKVVWNHLGLSYNMVGSCKQAIEAYRRSIAIDPEFKEGWANMAQAYRDYGDRENAELYYQRALSIDPSYFHAYHLRALTRHASGDHAAALHDLIQAVKLDPSHVECIYMKAVVQHGLGLLSRAIEHYKVVSAMRPEHVAWYQAEVALFVHHHLDTPLVGFNIDTQLGEYFKEAWCKRSHPALLVNYKSQHPLSTGNSDVKVENIKLSVDASAIIHASLQFGPKLQYHSPGYLVNKRQQAACGLAILELAQRLKGVWKNGESVVSGQCSSGLMTEHLFGWRDMYDILIKWRQYSEPNDPVWWVDLLSPEQFEEGFGSHTPMISGQTQVVRYYPMFKRSFEIMKNLLPDQHKRSISQEELDQIREAQDCETLYRIMNRDFWVVTPCYSSIDPTLHYEGTRLTLQLSPPEGYEYSIRTPGTPPRWTQYDRELSHAWSKLTDEASKSNPDWDKLSDCILTVSFYWYNFMPLSRGTAAVGYMATLAMFLANDIEITASVPQDVQVDWEGILTPRAEDFIHSISSWMYPARATNSVLHSLPSVQKAFPTIRLMIEALNAITTNQLTSIK